jgi:hypothetical protein
MKRDGLYRNPWLVAVGWETLDYCDPRSSHERDGREGEREVAIQNKVPSQSPRLARLAISRLTVAEVNEAIKHLCGGKTDWGRRLGPPESGQVGCISMYSRPGGYSSKPRRSHSRDTKPKRPLPSRNPHEISCQDIHRVIAAANSSSSGHRILVSNLLHRTARKRNSIDSLRKTAIIDQLLAPIAEQLRRVRNHILY